MMEQWGFEKRPRLFRTYIVCGISRLLSVATLGRNSPPLLLVPPPAATVMALSPALSTTPGTPTSAWLADHLVLLCGGFSTDLCGAVRSGVGYDAMRQTTTTCLDIHGFRSILEPSGFTPRSTQR